MQFPIFMLPFLHLENNGSLLCTHVVGLASNGWCSQLYIRDLYYPKTINPWCFFSLEINHCNCCVRKSNVLRHTHSFHQWELCTLAWDVDHGAAIGLATLQRLQGEVHSVAEVLLGAGGTGKEVGRFYKKISGWISWFLSYMQYESNWYTADVLLALYIIQYFLWFCTLYIFIKTVY